MRKAFQRKPFAHYWFWWLQLDFTRLAAGQYTVVAQGVQASFTLTADNLAPHQLYLPFGSH